MLQEHTNQGKEPCQRAWAGLTMTQRTGPLGSRETCWTVRAGQIVSGRVTDWVVEKLTRRHRQRTAELLRTELG